MKIEVSEDVGICCFFLMIAICAVACFWALSKESQYKAQIEIKKLELAIAQYSAKE